jgi:uncharacterized protein
MTPHVSLSLPLSEGQVELRELREADHKQVLSLLAQDPVHNVILRGLIMDHGMCAPELRGILYGYFDYDQLTGVALIGHQLFVYAPDEALTLIARKAVETQARIHIILGPEEQVEKLWSHLAQAGRETRRLSAQRMYLCQRTNQTPVRQQLIRANYAELDVVADAQAEMALEASGVDPRQSDPAGFRHRVVERLERKRIWVKIAEGKVVFKADILSDTPDTVYLEGIWTHPDYRDQGIAKRCLAELVQQLLWTRQTVCLFTDDSEKVAQRVYEHVGFQFAATYQARFLFPPVTADA